MKLLPRILFGVALFSPAMAAAADSPGADALARKAEACIREHAAGVAGFSPTLADAASFLVEDVCAQPIEAYRNYRQSETTLATYRSAGLAEAFGDEDAPPSRQRTAALKQQAAKARADIQAMTIDPDTGELRSPPGGDVGGSITVMLASTIGTNRDARFRSVAAEAILAARQAAAPKP